MADARNSGMGIAKLYIKNRAYLINSIIPPLAESEFKRGEKKCLNPSTIRDQKGFTLIELLIVIAIIAILAAIALPQFAAYRERGVRATMISDARNAVSQLEGTFADCQAYPVGGRHL